MPRLWEGPASFPDLIWAQKVLEGRDPAGFSASHVQPPKKCLLNE